MIQNYWLTMLSEAKSYCYDYLIRIIRIQRACVNIILMAIIKLFVLSSNYQLAQNSQNHINSEKAVISS